jgi:hypothetical protein
LATNEQQAEGSRRRATGNGRLVRV